MSKHAGYNIPQKQLRDPRATRCPETARPRQVPPTQQPWRSPAKERASQPNSASDDFSKLRSRRRQVITIFPFGSVVERSILDKQSVSSNPPVSSFLLFFFAFFSAVGKFKSPCLFFIVIRRICLLYCTYIRVLLLYCCTHMVGSWVGGGEWLFLLCTVIYCCTRYNVLL